MICEKRDRFDWTFSQFVCTNHQFKPDPTFIKSMASKLGSSPAAEMAFITGYGMGCLPNGTSNHFQLNSSQEQTSEIPTFQSIQDRLNQLKNSSEGSTVAPIGATSIPSKNPSSSEGSTAAPVGAASIPSKTEVQYTDPSVQANADRLQRELEELTRKAEVDAKPKSILKTSTKSKESTESKENLDKKSKSESQCDHANEIETYKEEKDFVFHTSLGVKFPLTTEHRIQDESKEDTLYFFQMIQLAGKIIMLFYDNGAAIGIILGAIAHKLRLEIIDKCRQAISGAANMLHRSPYGKYAIYLGPLRDGSFHRVTMVGLQSITYNVPKYDLSEKGMNLENEVRAHCQKFNLELPTGVFPKEIGGGGAGMVLGVKQPRLLPKTKFILPSGLIVAETELEDIWGSRIVFGGTLKQITEANENAGIHFASVLGQSFYSME
jgi:hypothetical protein